MKCYLNNGVNSYLFLAFSRLNYCCHFASMNYFSVFWSQIRSCCYLKTNVSFNHEIWEAYSHHYSSVSWLFLWICTVQWILSAQKLWIHERTHTCTLCCPVWQTLNQCALHLEIFSPNQMEMWMKSGVGWPNKFIKWETLLPGSSEAAPYCWLHFSLSISSVNRKREGMSSF